MLVDADKAKEKLAKVCDDIVRDKFSDVSAMQCARAIRQTDLTDCAPITPTANVVVLQLRNAAIEIALEGHAGWGNICTDAADLIESLSAQVAELKKDAERLTTMIGMMFEHSLHFRMIGNNVQLCTNSTILGEGIGANDAIDAAKESGNE